MYRFTCLYTFWPRLNNLIIMEILSKDEPVGSTAIGGVQRDVQLKKVN